MSLTSDKWTGFLRLTQTLNLPVYRRGLMLGGLLIGAAILWPNSQVAPSISNENQPRVAIQLDLSSILAQLPESRADIQQPSADFDYVIAKGDTLSELFMRANVDQQTMYRVLEADLNILALDTLKPGNQIRFWLNDQGQLEKLELYFNLARQVHFTRYDDGSYKVDEVDIEGIWQNRQLSGQINGSFYLSAKRIGLSAGQIQRIEGLLKEKVNFSKDLRAGDQFSILMSEQYVEGEASGQSQILGINIDRGRKTVSAYQHEDGNFYDEKGQSLARAFQRTPLLKRYRLTSNFNPKRKHPVTHRVSPHNGTDFATPVGTKIVAPGDGVVTLVTNHRYAGKYVVIQHGNKYRTRYLHLSKALVKKGQRVSRGQVIALSGKTGRITGAHLHYEFHINGRPVDPMKAKIPMAKQLPKKEMKRFSQLVSTRKMIMGLS